MIITYEVYVNVESHQDKAIELNDTITRGTTFDNLEWEYSGKGGKHADDYVKLTVVSDTEKTITIGDQNGADEELIPFDIQHPLTWAICRMQRLILSRTRLCTATTSTTRVQRWIRG